MFLTLIAEKIKISENECYKVIKVWYNVVKQLKKIRRIHYQNKSATQKKEGLMKKYIFGILFILVSVVILIVGIFVSKNIGSKSYEKITGIISYIHKDKEYDSHNGTKTVITFYVDYTYNGQTYKNVKIDYSDAFKREGDKIDFYININNPDEITINPQMPIIVCIILASGFLIMGIINIIPIKKKTNEY